MKTADGSPCGFALRDEAGKVVNCFAADKQQRVMWLRHLQEEHGLLLSRNDAVRFCEEHGSWQIGWPAVEEHAREHYLALAAAPEEVDAAKFCVFCLANPSLPLHQQALQYTSGQNLAQHINGTHIFNVLVDEYE